jgi:hypothetical protein
MNTVPSQRDVAEALEAIAKYVSVAPAETPALFVIKLAQKWKEKGGLVAGKPRHSDRYLDTLLRRGGTPIRSLTPKLNGKTQIKPADAEELIRLFLTHWEYVGDPHSNEPAPRSADRYKALFTHAEIEGICTYVADRISELGPESRSAAAERVTAQPAPGEDASSVVATEFKDAAAYFQIGSGRHTVLVAQEDTILLGFRDLMERLWTIDSADSAERILIWTLDLGRRDFEDLESRLRFMNVQEVVARFKAMKQFKERHSDERWNWLQSHTVVVLHDIRGERPAATRLPAFDPNHVLFSAIPPAWAGSAAFETLYGRERVRDTNYSIFLKKITAESGRNRTEPRYEMHYFGHALLNDDKGEQQRRTLQLESPGRSYMEALGTVFQAAARTLGLGNITRPLWVDGMRIDSEHAIEKLQHHGFHLLRLEDFLTY